MLDKDDKNIFFETENDNIEESEESESLIPRIDLQSVLKYQIYQMCCSYSTISNRWCIKDKTVIQTIENARRVCKELPTPMIRGILKAVQKRKPILGYVTRWHSTVDMIECLLEFKDCCNQSNKDLYLMPETWNKLKSIVESLLLARIATKKLREKQLTIGDFYYVWIRCILETSKINTTLSNELVNAMKKRQTQLF